MLGNLDVEGVQFSPALPIVIHNHDMMLFDEDGFVDSITNIVAVACDGVYQYYQACSSSKSPTRRRSPSMITVYPSINQVPSLIRSACYPPNNTNKFDEKAIIENVMKQANEDTEDVLLEYEQQSNYNGQEPNTVSQQGYRVGDNVYLLHGGGSSADASAERVEPNTSYEHVRNAFDNAEYYDIAREPEEQNNQEITADEMTSIFVNMYAQPTSNKDKQMRGRAKAKWVVKQTQFLSTPGEEHHPESP